MKHVMHLVHPLVSVREHSAEAMRAQLAPLPPTASAPVASRPAAGHGAPPTALPTVTGRSPPVREEEGAPAPVPPTSDPPPHPLGAPGHPTLTALPPAGRGTAGRGTVGWHIPLGCST